MNNIIFYNFIQRIKIIWNWILIPLSLFHIVIHELGHLIIFKIFGGKNYIFSVSWEYIIEDGKFLFRKKGFIRPNKIFFAWQWKIIALGGIIAEFFMFAIFLFGFSNSNFYISLLSTIISLYFLIHVVKNAHSSSDKNLFHWLSSFSKNMKISSFDLESNNNQLRFSFLND